MTAVARSLLPPNATPLERAVEQSLARIGGIDVAAVDTVWNPHTCPEALLPYLAWAWGVYVWNPAWPTSVKRAVIAAAPQVKRLKGTVGALRRAIGAIGARLIVSEWWQTGEAPYTASVRIYAQGASGQPQLSPELLVDLQTAFRAAAPARVHYTARFGVEFPTVPIVGALMRPIETSRRAATTQVIPAAAVRIGAALMRPIALLRQLASTPARVPGGAALLTGALLRPIDVCRVSASAAF